MKEIKVSANTVELAVQDALKQLNIKIEQLEYTVITEPKKNLFGKVKVQAEISAKAKVVEEKPQSPQAVPTNVENKQPEKASNTVVKSEKPSEPTPVDNSASEQVSFVKPQQVNPFSLKQEDYTNEIEMKKKIAHDYLSEVIEKMGLTDIKIDMEMKEGTLDISIDGEGIALLIGRRGETLYSLQYLVSLVCGKMEGDFLRIALNCGNYKEKREETLKVLATRISEKVKRTGRSQYLESMNPYERRIIHSVVADMEGVISKSNGDEPNRKVVIMSEKRTDYKPRNKGARPNNNNNNNSRPNGNRNNNNNNNRNNNNDNAPISSVKKPVEPYKPEPTMEEILKGEYKDKELYSKIDLG